MLGAVGTSEWQLGVFLVILHGFMSVSGVTLQRLAFLQLQKAALGESKPVWRYRKWRIGLLLYILAQPLNWVGLTLCPVTLAGPLGCGTILFASVLSSRYFGEEYTYDDKLALFIGSVGLIGTILYGPHAQDLELELRKSRELMTFWRHPDVSFVIFSTLGFLGICMALVCRGGRSAAFAHPFVCAIFGGLSDICVKVLGMFATQGLRFVLTHKAEIFVPLVLYIFFGVMSVYTVTKGAEKYDGRYFVTSVTSLLALVLAFFGIFVFQEFSYCSMAHKVIFGQCAALCVMSVLLGSDHPVTTAPEQTVMELRSLAEIARQKWNRKPDKFASEQAFQERVGHLYQTPFRSNDLESQYR